MIQCSRCGREYHDSFSTCPNCGFHETFTFPPSSHAESLYQPSEGEKEQVTVWYKQYGGIFKDLDTDFETLRESLGTRDAAAIVREAQKLKDNLATWRSYPPIPYAPIGVPFSAALASCAAVAQDTIDGALNDDQALFDRATDGINQFCTYMAQVQVAIDAMGQ